jgi:tellurite resistance-related uncharacterized protein
MYYICTGVSNNVSIAVPAPRIVEAEAMMTVAKSLPDCMFLAHKEDGQWHHLSMLAGYWTWAELEESTVLVCEVFEDSFISLEGVAEAIREE